MGRKIVLTGTTLTDLSAPKLAKIDVIESDGSLLLIEPMHLIETWGGGVPADGTVIPNLFLSPLAMDDATLEVKGGITNGTKGKVERSGKGGLHVIVSQAGLLATTDGCRILPGATTRSYIMANKTHEYYVSFWDRLTRANPNTTNFTMDYILGASTDPEYCLVGSRSGTNWAPTSPAASGERSMPNTVGPRFSNVAKTGTPGFTDGINASGLPIWGPVNASTYNGQVISTRNDRWSSFVFYRAYVEDLTVSGRTYEEVDAIDYALYTKEVLTPGGRYYGDTFTDPATIP